MGGCELINFFIWNVFGWLSVFIIYVEVVILMCYLWCEEVV